MSSKFARDCFALRIPNKCIKQALGTDLVSIGSWGTTEVIDVLEIYRNNRRDISILRTRLTFQFEYSFHLEPLLTWHGFWKSLLKFPHEFFPLLHFRIRTVRRSLCFEGKALLRFHDHEHPCSEEIDLHVTNARVANTPGDLGPDLLVVAFVLGDQLRIVFQIEGETETASHSSSPAGTDMAATGAV